MGKLVFWDCLGTTAQQLLCPSGFLSANGNIHQFSLVMPLIAYSLSLLWRNTLPFPFLPCFREFLYPSASLTNSFYPLQPPFPPSLPHKSCQIHGKQDNGPRVQLCELLGAGTRGWSRDGGLVTSEDGQPCQLSQQMCHHSCRIRPFLHTQTHNQGLYWEVCFLFEPQQ